MCAIQLSDTCSDLKAYEARKCLPISAGQCSLHFPRPGLPGLANGNQLRDVSCCSFSLLDQFMGGEWGNRERLPSHSIDLRVLGLGKHWGPFLTIHSLHLQSNRRSGAGIAPHAFLDCDHYSIKKVQVVGKRG